MVMPPDPLDPSMKMLQVGSRGLRLQDEPHDAYEAREDDPVDGEWRLWRDEIQAGMAAEKRWRTEAEGAEDEYFGKDEPLIGKGAQRKAGQVHTVHANVETLKPTVYSQTPEPVVTRRFKDGKEDPVDGIVAEVAQRLAIAAIDLCEFDAAVEEARDDWLIVGRATARVMYGAEFGEEPAIDPMAGQPMLDPATQQPVMQEVKQREWVEVRPWHWRRCVFSPAERWADVRWIAYETFMTRKEVEQHPAMGPEVAEGMNFHLDGLGRPDRLTPDKADAMWEPENTEQTGARVPSTRAQAVVWEIWDKEAREVVYWAPMTKDGLVGRMDDPLGLEGFFDTPAPLMGAKKSGSMEPRPEIAYYIEHAKEVDLASEKLQRLLKIISVSGIYAGEQSSVIQRLLRGENRMIGIADWMAFVEKGGLKGMIEWLPLDAIMKAAQALIQMRELSKATIYEITGMSDTIRGQGDPNATATQERIQGQYAGLRMNWRQRRFALFVRDVIRMMLEISCEHFDTETIAEMTGMELPMTEAEREQIAQVAALIEQGNAMKAQLEQAMAAGQQAQTPDEAQQAMVQVQQLGMQANMLAQQLAAMGIDPANLPPAPEVPETSWEVVHQKLRDDLMRAYIIQIETDGTILTDEAEDREARIEFLGSIVQMAQGLSQLSGIGADFRLVKELLLFGVRGFRKARTLEHLITSLPDEIEEPQQQEDASIAVAKIKAQVDQMLGELDSQTKIAVAEINARTDITEQQLENEVDREQMRANAAQAQEDRAEARRMKGVDLKARAAEMGAST